jgi:hypothetical protein
MGDIDYSLRMRERALMDKYRDQLLVNSPYHRPERLHFFMPCRLITNASPTGSSNPRAAFGFYTAGMRRVVVTVPKKSAKKRAKR